MGIDMWFSDDVARLLESVQLAQERIMAYVPQMPESLAYRSGCADTLDALATAFGLPSNNWIKLTQTAYRDIPGETPHRTNVIGLLTRWQTNEAEPAAGGDALEDTR